MIPRDWTSGEVAVLGLGKSGHAAARLLLREGARVYVSDADTSRELRETAEMARGAGASVDLGMHDLERIARSSLVVISPGIPPSAPPIRTAREAGVRVVSEIEVALQYLPHTRLIAITGTNGKTTTTALVGHILRSLGHDAVDAGNIGTPLCDVALSAERPAWVSLELSSFQLHDTPSIRPAVGVLTNVTPDHLDRYVGVAEYYADKALLFRNDSPASLWVLNGDQELVGDIAVRLRSLSGERHQFSLRNSAADAYYDRAGKMLMLFGKPLLRRDELAMFGDHNVANALAASLAVMLADAQPARDEARVTAADALRSFRALKHRLEVVGEFGGVLWINDSKATNVSSTLVAIEGMTRPTVLLLGGRHKGEPYTALAEPLRRVGKRVIAYGEAAPIVAKDLDSRVAVDRMGSSFEDVIKHAREVARPGDVVLLSPACSSYDMFKNYEERGAAFRRLAAETV